MVELTEDERLSRKIEDKIKRAISDYGLINDGDRILIGLSGGKNSLASVSLLGRRSKVYRPRFEVVVAYITMINISYRSDREYLRSCAEEHDLPFIVHEASFDPPMDIRKSPCLLYSWTRRKALFGTTKAHRRNKIASGHRQDDILETLLMNPTHQGTFETMPPRLRMDKLNAEIIRPTCLVEKRELTRVAVWKGYRKQSKNCPCESGSSRSGVKELLRSLKAVNPEARYGLWGSMMDIQEDYLFRKIR